MLKTNKEIEKEFDDNFKYFCQEHSCCFGNGEELKSFIHQTRIADLEEMERMVKDKITSHYFDGSCCYNNNENGKGHPECRYPYNPGKTEPKGEQCLKLKEEHFSDFIQKVKEEVFA